jgi:histidinol-phosphate/aromatic aminotransferase/cobyric acid decarboxylase-like protein/adenosyl cobinamide kinase/adenosyl cobinamide phosphate guanylyltransferase
VSLTLVIGGTRSGKSRRGEQLAAETGLPVRYVATADPGDASMAERIRTHVERRPADWTTVEVGDSLADAVGAGHCVLVDGLGPWIATELHRADAFEEASDAALARVRAGVEAGIDGVLAAAGERVVIVVAEEAGGGVLPPDAASRAWVDMLGEAVQRLADAADHAELVVAGRAIPLGPSAVKVRGARGGLPDRAFAELRHHGDAVVRPGDADHAVNVMRGGPPPWLREDLHRALDDDAGHYPRENDAVTALAELHGRSRAEIVPTNGAAEALWLLPAALRPRHAVVIHPGFTESEAALHAHDVPVTRVIRNPDRDFALDPLAVPDDADLVVVGNPASPSGTLDPATAILALRRPGRTVVVDEAFMDLVPGSPGSLAHESLDDVIVVRSLTKVLSVPGLRVGYALAGASLARRLRDVRPPWSANALALAALASAARRHDAVAAIAARADTERRDLARRIGAIEGVRVWPGGANFVLIEVDDGHRVTEALRERAIAIRPAASFPGLGSNHLRLTARGDVENSRLAAALAAAVGTVRA